MVNARSVKPHEHPFEAPGCWSWRMALIHKAQLLQLLKCNCTVFWYRQQELQMIDVLTEYDSKAVVNDIWMCADVVSTHSVICRNLQSQAATILYMIGHVAMITSGGHFFLRIREQMLSWMMDEFIHWPKPYLLLSTTCVEIVMDDWKLDQNHLVIDSNCNSVNL